MSWAVGDVAECFDNRFYPALDDEPVTPLPVGALMRVNNIQRHEINGVFYRFLGFTATGGHLYDAANFRKPHIVGTVCSLRLPADA